MSQDAFAHFVNDDTSPPGWTGKTPSGNTADDIRNVAPPGALLYVGGEPAYAPMTQGEIAAWSPPFPNSIDPVEYDMRLKRCGLVWHEDQLTSERWVSRPAGRDATRAIRIKVLPLFMVKPAPGLEIEATDGEKYILPADFTGDWFSVTSPKGVKLIA